MEVPRREDESELQPPAYTTATAMPDLSHIRSLHHSSRQRWILSPLSEVRDGTHDLMVPSQFVSAAHDGNSLCAFLKPPYLSGS